jgi:hypothetical protein
MTMAPMQKKLHRIVHLVAPQKIPKNANLRIYFSTIFHKIVQNEHTVISQYFCLWSNTLFQTKNHLGLAELGWARLG